jgi:outer membrane protein assembly factor BamB
MPILGKKRIQLERNLKRANSLLDTAESKGIEILEYKQALYIAGRDIKNKEYQKAEDAIKNAMIFLQNDLDIHERATSLKAKEMQESREMIQRIDGYLAGLKEQGIDLKIELFDDVRRAFDGGTDIDVRGALDRIDSMFRKPIFKPEKAWGYSSKDRILGILTVHDMIIISTEGNAIIALDLNGEQLWKFRSDENVLTLGTYGNLVLAGSMGGKVHCIDALGTELWVFNAGGGITGIRQYHDLLIVGSKDRMVYCLDSEGNQLWKCKIGGEVTSLDVLHDFVLSGSDDKHVYCLTHNGKLNWKVKTGDRVNAVLAYGNLILNVGEDDHVYCSDLDGNLEWKKHFPEDICSFVVVGNNVCIGLASNELCFLDDQGKDVMRVEVEGPIVSMIVERGLIFAGSKEKLLYCLTPDGDILWKKKTGNPVSYIRSTDDFLLVQSGKRIVAHPMLAVPVLIEIEQQIREGRIQFTNIYEAEQLFELAKDSFQKLESEKAGRLLNKVKDILDEHKKRVKYFKKVLSVHKPEFTEFDKILETEYRDKVVQGINSAQNSISDIQSILTTLLGKRANIESTLNKQKEDKDINRFISDYREKLTRAKKREKMSVARSYAFMVVNQKRKLRMKEKMRTVLFGIDEQIQELSDFSKDLFENAMEMPHDADLVGAFGILNNEAVHAITEANKLIGDINEMETELNEVALENELSIGREDIMIDGLHADVKAEIEKELE